MSPELTVRQPLTAERLRELADRGLSQTEIATETGYSRQRVNSACRAAGIEPTKKPWSPPIEHQRRATAGRLAKGQEHIEVIRQCAADGMTATRAAVKLGTTRDAIYTATHRHKIAFVKERKPKRKAPARKALPMKCKICGAYHLAMGRVWPLCGGCRQRIAGHVAGSRQKRAARQAAAAVRI